MATQQGEQAIGTLKVGAKVWAYNPSTKTMELQPILHVWINHDNDLVDLTITKPAQRKATRLTSEVLHTNQKHPFLTVEKGFLPVGQMKLGMHVVEANGQVGMVSGWKVVPGVKVMYNLEVAQDHTFMVGVGQWVVHNCGGGGVNIPESKYSYLFGDATGSQHNLDRSNGLALQMKRLGVLDTSEGRAILGDHLTSAALDANNVVGQRVNEWGTFVTKESLFAGPSGKFSLFHSVWQAGEDGGLRFTTLIAHGG